MSPESVAPHVRCYPCARHKAPNSVRYRRVPAYRVYRRFLRPVVRTLRTVPAQTARRHLRRRPPQTAEQPTTAESTITFSSVIHFTFNIIQSFHLRGDTPIEDQATAGVHCRDSSHISAASVKSPIPKFSPIRRRCTVLGMATTPRRQCHRSTTCAVDRSVFTDRFLSTFRPQTIRSSAKGLYASICIATRTASVYRTWECYFELIGSRNDSFVFGGRRPKSDAVFRKFLRSMCDGLSLIH